MSTMQQAQETNSLRTKLIVLALLLALILVIYAFSKAGGGMSAPATKEQTDASLSEEIRKGVAPIPEFTEATQAKLAGSQGFQYLVSYTDDGFEPAVLTIMRGETVRFTNNSSDDLWIAADGSEVQIYPRTKEICGSSDLDSCEPFESRDFWEFTFENRGEWGVVNNLDKSKSGIVIVW